MRVLRLPNSMPRTVHLCALLLFLCSSTSCFGSQYEECLPDKYLCGGIDFAYPFGINGSGCGDPAFQLLSCDSDSHPRINISGNIYHILQPVYLRNNSKHSMTIVSDDIWAFRDKPCDLSVNYSQSWWYDPQIFHVDARYTKVTFWRDCPQNIPAKIVMNRSLCEGREWYYSLDPSIKLQEASICETQLQLPIEILDLPLNIDPPLLEQGFEITWSVDNKINQRCAICWESKGTCGSNSSEPFLCYCPDDTVHPDKCPSHGGRNKSATATIIGCSIGGAALIAIAVVLFFAFYGKRRKQPPPPRSSISRVEKFLSEYAYEMPTRYTQSDLKRMTNSFAEKLGEGGFGVVYKGKLRNGTLVAVKLLDRQRHNESTQFLNEVDTIGRLHHVNLVRLLGYCFESPTSALVYEYMVNGSLEKFIFAGKEKGQVLTWEQLYSIALGAARGIAYLHQDCEKRIIHFDIKPHNILLDSQFTPKVSDFGLAKLCAKGDDHISVTGARGTPGYVAPEVWSRDLGPVTDKSDVYSFGMLLLEIVGGRKNFDVQVSRSSQLYFPEWAFKLLESGELGMRLRVGVQMEVENEEKARRLTKIGLWCIQYKSTDRPCMSRVVQMLEGNGDDVSTPPLPFNCSADPENPLLSSGVTSSIEIRL